jgi:hypothetical protein
MKILSRTIRKARGKHCARIRYEDENDNHELLRTCDSKSEAKTKLAQLETELLEKGPAQLDYSTLMRNDTPHSFTSIFKLIRKFEGLFVYRTNVISCLQCRIILL